MALLLDHHADLVLALLPIPAGNIDQNRAYNHLMAMRADLQQAARRSQNLQEFKDMIRDMRLRKEREEEFKRNRDKTAEAKSVNLKKKK